MLGEEVQKLSVVQSLPELLNTDKGGCLQKLVPKIQQSLPNASTEYHMVTSQAVKHIIHKNIMSADAFVTAFLQTILTSIDNRDPAVADAWIEALLDILDLLPLKVVQSEITPVALARSQMSKPVPVRVSSCRLLGRIAQRYDGQLVKKDLLGTVTSLCQDVNADVRAMMCAHLASVIKQLGNDLSESNLLPFIIELASDEVSKVKEAAFITILDILKVFNTDVLKYTLVPMLKQLITYAFKMDECLLLTITSQYSKMCLGIERALQPSEKETFIKWYIGLAQLGLQAKRIGKSKVANEDLSVQQANIGSDKYVLCRQFCAQNLSGMALFCKSEPDALARVLHPVFSDLVTDSCYVVRKTIASNFHQVMNVYAGDCAPLKNDFISLLKEETEEVINGFIPHISENIAQFIKYKVYTPETTVPEPQLVELTRTLMKCETTVATSLNWRSQVLLFEQFECLHRLLSSDSLYNNFVLLLFKRINTCRAVPVRLAAVRTLLVYLRYIQKLQHRNEIRNKIINDLCCSSNFYERMLYIRSCDLIMELFSTTYFKEHFYIKTVALLDDNVANIRWATCRLLVRLKGMLKLSMDKKLILLIDSAISNIKADNDREVLRLLQTILPLLDKPVDFNKLFPNDQKKLEEEKLLAASGEVSSGQTGVGNITGGEPTRPTPTGRYGQGASPASGRRLQGQEQQGSSPSFTSGPSSALSSSTTLGQPQQPQGPPGRSRLVRPTQPSSGRVPREEEEEVAVMTPAPQPATTKVFRQPSYLRQSRHNNNINNYNNNNNNNNSGGKRSEGIPVRRPLQVHRRDENRQDGAQTNYKRHSLQVSDLNHNDTSDKVDRKELQVSSDATLTPTRTRRQSHLPRPLSCINFSVKGLEGVNKPAARQVTRHSLTRPTDARYQRRT